jgi:hypothetical protein
MSCPSVSLSVLKLSRSMNSRHPAGHAGAGGHGHPQAVVQQAAVRQPGQGVVKGQMPDLFLSRLAQGDVGQRRHVVGDLALAVPDGGNRQPLREDLAVLAAVPDLALPGPVRSRLSRIA